jgi:Spy/CpxP family protein refolding chaperone
MTRFRTWTAGVLVAGLLAGGVAFAQGPGALNRGGRGARIGGPGGPGDFGLPLGQLNLSDAQRQQIRDLIQKGRQDGETAQARLRTAMEARRQAMEAIPLTEGAIRSTTADLVAAETDVAIQQAHVRADVLALLNPDQLDQVKKLRADREARLDNRARRQQNHQNQKKP